VRWWTRDYYHKYGQQCIDAEDYPCGPEFYVRYYGILGILCFLTLMVFRGAFLYTWTLGASYRQHEKSIHRILYAPLGFFLTVRACQPGFSLGCLPSTCFAGCTGCCGHGCLSLLACNCTPLHSSHPRLPLSLFPFHPLQTPVGDLLVSFTKDQDTMDDALPDALYYSGIYGLILLATTITVSVTIPLFSALAGALFVVSGLMLAIYLPAATHLKKLRMGTSGAKR
jgi:hypothetical protein